MRFYCGIHHPAKAGQLEYSFVSVNALWERKSDFHPKTWIMDSGAFTEIAKHGGYRVDRGVRAYAGQVARWQRCGQMVRAVAQDYMCEPEMLERANGTVQTHQAATIARYDALIQHVPSNWIMPCLQGQAPEDYAAHVEAYGGRLGLGHYVGVGSVCKRKKDSAIREILRAIHAVRPDLRLHGFGLKVSALRCAEVCDRLESADSMAWSFAARYEGRNPNCVEEAKRWASRIERMPRQEVLL